jgi:hypothetical protein
MLNFIWPVPKKTKASKNYILIGINARFIRDNIVILTMFFQIQLPPSDRLGQPIEGAACHTVSPGALHRSDDCTHMREQKKNADCRMSIADLNDGVALFSICNSKTTIVLISSRPGVRRIGRFKL